MTHIAAANVADAAVKAPVKAAASGAGGDARAPRRDAGKGGRGGKSGKGGKGGPENYDRHSRRGPTDAHPHEEKKGGHGTWGSNREAPVDELQGEKIAQAEAREGEEAAVPEATESDEPQLSLAVRDCKNHQRKEKQRELAGG